MNIEGNGAEPLSGVQTKVIAARMRIYPRPVQSGSRDEKLIAVFKRNSQIIYIVWLYSIRFVA